MCSKSSSMTHEVARVRPPGSTAHGPPRTVSPPRPDQVRAVPAATARTGRWRTPVCLLERVHSTGPCVHRRPDRVEHRLDQHPDLQPGQTCPEAEVRAVPERQVTVRAASGVERVGLGELALVTVGRGPPQRDLVPGPDGLPAQVRVAGGRPAVVRRGRRPPQHLLDGDRDGRAVRRQPVPRVGMVGQGGQARRRSCCGWSRSRPPPATRTAAAAHRRAGDGSSPKASSVTVPCTARDSRSSPGSPGGAGSAPSRTRTWRPRPRPNGPTSRPGPGRRSRAWHRPTR